MSNIRQNLESVRNRIRAVATRAGRDPAAIRLVAVSKTKPADLIREAFEAGQTAFGENYAQEMKEKADALAGLPIEWHFIGHLQRNKAKVVAPIASWIESIDSNELAEAIDRHTAQRISCLIEVNVGDESSKSGARAEDVVAIGRRIVALDHLDLKGLMIIPPYDPDPEKSRPFFRALRELRDQLIPTLGAEHLRELSMGMSHDFEAAIEEGATIVRIGTAIFGERG